MNCSANSSCSKKTVPASFPRSAWTMELIWACVRFELDSRGARDSTAHSVHATPDSNRRHHADNGGKLSFNARVTTDMINMMRLTPATLLSADSHAVHHVPADGGLRDKSRQVGGYHRSRSSEASHRCLLQQPQKCPHALLQVLCPMSISSARYLLR